MVKDEMQTAGECCWGFVEGNLNLVQGSPTGCLGLSGLASVKYVHGSNINET